MRLTLALLALALTFSCAPQLRFKNGLSASPKSLGFTNWTYVVQGVTFELTNYAKDEYGVFKEVKADSLILGTFSFSDTNNRVYTGSNTFPNITLGVFKQFYRYTWTTKAIGDVDTMIAE